MTQVTTSEEDRVQFVIRVPNELKLRVERLKYSRSEKESRRVTNDEIMISAAEEYLKKFGY